MASVPSPVTFVGKRTSWISKEVIVTSDMVRKMECSNKEDKTLRVSPRRPYKHVAVGSQWAKRNGREETDKRPRPAAFLPLAPALRLRLIRSGMPPAELRERKAGMR